MMKYKSLFIDLDDTLWDTYHNNKECLEEVYTAHHFDRYYASFEAFFEIYWPHNNLLWEQYRNNEIDRQTLIIERFRYMLRPLGIEDTKSVLAINNDFLQRTTRKTRLVPEICRFFALENDDEVINIVLENYGDYIKAVKENGERYGTFAST